MEILELDQQIADVSLTDARPFVINIWQILLAIGKHKRPITCFTVGLSVIVAALSLLLPNWYTATTKILPPQQTQSTASMVLNQLAATTSLISMAGRDLGLKSPNDMYIGMLKSRTVADSLVSKYDLLRVYKTPKLSSARNALGGHTDITTGKEGLITISVEDKDPKRAAVLANAYVSELRNVTQNLAITESSQRRLFFEQQLERAKGDLAIAEVALKDTQQRTGMIQLDSQAKAVIESVGILRAQIASKEVELQAMRTFATEQNPDYVMLQQQIAALNVQLTNLIKQHPVANADDPILATSSVPGVALEYVRRLREVKYREAVFELLAKQFEAAKIDESKQAALIQVLDPAVEPDRKSAPSRALICVFTFVLALFGSCAAAVAKEALEEAKRDPLTQANMDRVRATFWGFRKRTVI